MNPEAYLCSAVLEQHLYFIILCCCLGLLYVEKCFYFSILSGYMHEGARTFETALGINQHKTITVTTVHIIKLTPL